MDEPRELRVQLSSCGNIDHGENPNRPVPGVPVGNPKVGSLREASLACRAYRDEHGLGGGQWTGGDVRDSAGALVARVSYNGRVWHGDMSIQAPAPAKAKAKAKKPV